MITALLASVALSMQTQTQQPPSGAALISGMFKHYAGAGSLVGKIHMIQTAQNVSVTLDTIIAYEAPSKLYLKQTQNSSEPRTWLITSDGTSFTYDYPNNRRFATSRPEPSRLEEAVTPVGGAKQNYQQIFRASTFSLGELAVPEFLAIGGTDCLQAIKDQIVTIQVMGTAKIGDQNVTIIGGDWRFDAHHRVSAKYQMFISDSGELKRYSQQETVAVKFAEQNMQPQQVLTTWDVDLQVNAKPDESLFNVVK